MRLELSSSSSEILLCGLQPSPEIHLARNYTGDVLNFGLAKEQYVALHPDEADRVKFVIVGDDVAVGRTQGKIVGRRYDHNIITRMNTAPNRIERGLAGTVLVYKIAGALATRGGSLSEVHQLAEWVSRNIVTIGASLSHVHVS